MQTREHALGVAQGRLDTLRENPMGPSFEQVLNIIQALIDAMHIPETKPPTVFGPGGREMPPVDYSEIARQMKEMAKDDVTRGKAFRVTNTIDGEVIRAD